MENATDLKAHPQEDAKVKEAFDCLYEAVALGITDPALQNLLIFICTTLMRQVGILRVRVAVLEKAQKT
jgi:hypothetical protein